MRFTNLWWLLLLPFLWVAVMLISRRGTRTVPARQHGWAVAVRLVVVSLLGVALCGPLLVRPVDTNAVFFVVDRSASIPAEARQAQDAYLDEALAQAAPGTVSGVLVFGSESRVDAPLRLIARRPPSPPSSKTPPPTWPRHSVPSERCSHRRDPDEWWC